jgi:hypothetical protein
MEPRRFSDKRLSDADLPEFTAAETDAVTTVVSAFNAFA